MKKLLLIFLIINSICYSQWQPTAGPKAAHITIFLNHPDGTIYAGTYTDGVFKSTDAGLTWQDISITSAPHIEANCFAYDSLYVYLGTNYYGIFRTSNKGLNWESIGPVDNNYINAMISVQGHLFAYSNGSLYVSLDFGNSWNLLNYPSVPCYSLIYQNGYLIAASDSTVYRSPDLGNSWQKTLTIFPVIYIPEITSSGNDLYLVGRHALYHSTDNALNWTPLNMPTTGYGNSIRYLNNSLFLATDSGLFKSIDGGYNWVQLNAGCPLSMFTRVISSGNVLLTGTHEYIYRSLDYGASWKSEYYYLHRDSISQVIAYGTNVLASNVPGAFYSTNNGDIWNESMNLGYPSSWAFVTSYAIDGNIVYAGTQHFILFKSLNNGLNWVKISSTSSKTAITSIYATGDTILYSSSTMHTPVSGSVHYSQNGGLSWQTILTARWGISDVKMKGNTIYAGSAYCLRKTSNLGQNWDTIYHRTVNKIQFGGNYIFASIFSGLIRSSDDGLSWTNISSGLDTNHNVRDLLFTANKLYCILDSLGIFISTNYGDSWLEFNDGFSSVNVTKLSANSSYIFAATSSGVWKRPIGDILSNGFKKDEIPKQFSLFQNYPNPFNPATKIKFDIPASVKSETSNVKLIIFDILGREVSTLVNEKLQPGTYEVEFDGSNYASGIYFYKLIAGNYTDSRKMLLIK